MASLRQYSVFVQRLVLPLFFFLCRSFVIAAEQKARVTYDNILRLSNDPDVNRVISYLREREIVHFQRFGEALDKIQAKHQNTMAKRKY